MERKPLSIAQRQHLDRLMITIKNAEADAQRFLGYCAAEAGIEIGRDGWVFNLDEMAFGRELPDSIEPFREGMLAALPQATPAGIPPPPGGGENTARNGDLHG